MLIVEIIGGLGNQMFGYVFSLAMRHHYGEDKVRCCTKAVNDNQGYELDRVFGIEKGDVLDKRFTDRLIDNSRSLTARIRRRLFGRRKSYFHERIPKYDPSVFQLDADKDIYVEGLWQDEDYFKDIKTKVVDAFRFKTKNISEENATALTKIKSTNSVSLHVRRGDYVSNPQYMGFLGGVCNMDYYQHALSLLESSEEELTIFVFSDDIGWVAENFAFLEDKAVVYIGHNKGLDSYMDMYLMSQCKHNIIANSTFSWWGAWLNQNPDKKVFAPEMWFLNNSYYDQNHIVPDHWIKVDNKPQT